MSRRLATFPQRVLRILATVLGAAALVLVVASSASAHMRYSCSEEYDPWGVCEYWQGYTRPADADTEIDPINLVWNPWGAVGNVVNALWDINWRWRDGGTQYNRRLVSDAYGYTYLVRAQEAQRASDQGPYSRYHARVFFGHEEGYGGWWWSVSDVHHEACCVHNIDRDWDVVEDQTVSALAGYRYGYTRFWTFLPRAQNTFQSYWSDGWASRVDAVPTAGG